MLLEDWACLTRLMLGLQWFVLFTALIMLTLAFLSFTGFAQSLPLNDIIIHLVCLCLATTVFYFIFDVEEYVGRYRSPNDFGLLMICTIGKHEGYGFGGTRR